MGMAAAVRVSQVDDSGTWAKTSTAPWLPWLLLLGALPGALMSTWLHAAAAQQPMVPLETVIRCMSATLTVVTLCPVLLGWLQGFDEPIAPLASTREQYAIGAAFAALGLLYVAVPWHLERFLELMLLTGPLLWLSLRGSHRAVTMACAAMAIGIGAGCSHGIGRFPALVTLGAWRDGILSVQGFLLITTMEALLINRIVLRQRALLQDSRHKQALLVSYGRALDDAEDATRRAAARDLHDGVAQIIAGQNMLLGVLRRRMRESHLHDLLDQAIAASSEAQSAVRATIEDLSPPAVDRATLREILTWLAEYFEQRYHFKVDWQISGEQAFDNHHSRLVYKAIRELIYNAFKHAQVESVRVELSSDATGTVISVIDAGVGFDPGAPAPDGRQRHGLTNLAERIAVVYGYLDIRTSAGRGCTVTIFLPAQESANGTGEPPSREPSTPGAARPIDRTASRIGGTRVV
jgi:signal transduction histidine kinase